MSTDVVARLESVAARLEAYAAKLGLGGSGGGESKGHPALGAYDDWVAGPVAAFEKAAHELKLEKIANSIKAGVSAVRNLIDATFHCKKPGDKKFLEPIMKVVTESDKAVPRKDEPNFAHYKSFAEAIIALSWVDAPGPAATVEGQAEAAQFYLDQILVVAKKAATEDEKAHHRAYVKSLKELLTTLADFAKSNFKMGLIWNAKGSDFASYKPGQSSSSSSSSGGPPSAPDLPPAPPVAPPAPVLPESTSSSSSSSSSSGGGMAGVFAQINAGKESQSATQAFGLKHVSKDMKSKNISAPVLTPKEKKDNELKAAKALLASESKKKGEPRIALDKGTWVVENYDDRHDLKVEDVQMKQAVYISNCSRCFIQVPDKCKQITMDKCSKTVVQFKNVVSTFEVVNSTSCKAQIDEYCPSVAIDKTHGFSVILMKDSYANPPEIITSNVSELNLVHPGATEKDDPLEHPLPEQYITKIDSKGKAAKLSTAPVSHGG